MDLSRGSGFFKGINVEKNRSVLKSRITLKELNMDHYYENEESEGSGHFAQSMLVLWDQDFRP